MRNTRRRRYGWYKRKGDTVPIKLHVISAVTGEITTAMAFDVSRAKYKKWLTYHNSRAELNNMHLPKNSTLARMTDDDWKNYPVIVKLGNYKTPYAVDHIGPKSTVNGRTTCPVYLLTVDNIDYISTISIKKKMANELLKVIKAEVAALNAEKRRQKRRKRSRRYDDDEI